MTHDDHELLSALLDREPVDPDALTRMLATAEGRELLVDFVRVRHTLHIATPDVDLARQALPVRTPPRRVVGQAAAAVLLLTVGGLSGAWLAARRDDRTRAPEPTRIVRLTPVDQPAMGGTR
jgi:hypothetical protein